ncbi:TetR/AcrR family transcriptional regulator [Nonomuraea rhizosphaerae]|uniref:TetR/AcrR family transcriptional regulator n=1 Tax=Nonomuraea rhizosphaerae TaxID=2665663 RepID=UPI001C5D8C3C|nr:TetR/AcrR family transcriptional regulator [Nonomuraea rhizosphaerae]
MSPRGVAIPDLRRRLFDAAERVLLRAGPTGLTGRAVTKEAGCAPSLLRNHFGDLDAFLGELFVDRARRASVAIARLPALAGTGDLAGNLVDTIDGLLTPELLALAGLAVARPSILSGTLTEALLEADAGERAFTAYLQAEQELGRLSGEADAESLALALVGAAHQLILTSGTSGQETAPFRERMRRVTSTLLPRGDGPG